MTKPLPIETILAKQLCTGCGACAALCGGKVPMRETTDSNRRPDFSAYPQGLHDPALAHACPAQDQSDRSTNFSDLETEFGPIFAVYEGYAADPEIRFKGSSGGAVTALALASLEDGATSGVLHVKASKTDPLLNEADISRDRAALLEGSGSRYSPASIADALPGIKNETGETTLIGKPCDISAAHMVADQDPVIAASIGAKIAIFCAGTPSHKGTKKLLEHMGARRDTIESLRYRGHGWPGAMTAKWRAPGGAPETAQISYSEGWGEILQAHRQWRCYVCADHTGEQADLSVGDPWQRPSGEDGHGRSLIVVRSARGAALLRAATEDGHLIAERVPNETLAAAQPNLIAAKGNAFGRSLALTLAGIPAPARRRDMWKCWLGLTTSEKLASLYGTWKRVIKKRLYRDHDMVWRSEITAPSAQTELGR